MIFARHFLGRFFLNVFSINLGLTLLFNLIEFFEKIVRVKQAPVETILYFIALNLIPSFFETLPLASWLGSCMTIKEMAQQNEWEISSLLNISIQKIFSLILFAGIFLASVSFIGREFVASNLESKAQQVKQEKLKQERHEKLLNQWFILDDNTFCYTPYLDLSTNEGINLAIITFTSPFKMEKITTAPSFSISPHDNIISIPQGTLLYTEEQKQQSITNEKLFLPSFFTQLRLHGKTPSLKEMFFAVTINSSTLPSHTYQHLLYLFFSRILIHLLLILYPLLTFALFFFVPTTIRWGLIFIPYPLVIILSLSTDFLMSLFHYGMLAVTPYVILFLLVIGAFFRVKSP